MGTWRVEIVHEARDDLRRLHKRKRKVWQAAIRLIESLENDPCIGDSCDPPLDDLRRIRFWNDQYRLVWLVLPKDEEVDVLIVALKTANLYGAVLDRVRTVVESGLGPSDP